MVRLPHSAPAAPAHAGAQYEATQAPPDPYSDAYAVPASSQDAPANGTANGSAVEIWTCTGANNQKWTR